MKEKAFRDFLHETIENYDTMRRSIERKMFYALQEYINVLQGNENGFIKFEENVGYPKLRLWNGKYVSILGVRVKNREENFYDLYIYTDVYPTENMDNVNDNAWSDGWHLYYLSGDINLYEILSYCRDYDNKMYNKVNA